MDYLKAFAVGGLICLIAQIFIDKTKAAPGRILVGLVVVGCILGGLGLYAPLVEFAGAGATVPLPGFGFVLAKGVMKEIDEAGVIGILTGGFKSMAAGVTAAVLFGLMGAFIFEPKTK